MKNTIRVLVVSTMLSGCMVMSTPPPASSVPIEETPVINTEVQTLLNEKGYDAGAADGVLGTKSREAIRKFETANNLPVDGVVDGALYAALKRSDKEPVLAPNDANVPSGEGMLGVRIDSANAAGVTLKRVFFSNDANNLRIADEHCAKYGKVSQFITKEKDIRRYNCVQP